MQNIRFIKTSLKYMTLVIWLKKTMLNSFGHTWCGTNPIPFHIFPWISYEYLMNIPWSMNIPWTFHEYEWIHHPKWRSPHFVRHPFPFTWSSSSQHQQLQNWWTSGVHHWGATAFIQKPHPLVPKSIGFEPQTCDEYSFHSARPDGNER